MWRHSIMPIIAYYSYTRIILNWCGKVTKPLCTSTLLWLADQWWGIDSDSNRTRRVNGVVWIVEVDQMEHIRQRRWCWNEWNWIKQCLMCITWNLWYANYFRAVNPGNWLFHNEVYEARWVTWYSLRQFVNLS